MIVRIIVRDRSVKRNGIVISVKMVISIPCKKLVRVRGMWIWKRGSVNTIVVAILEQSVVLQFSFGIGFF